MLRSLLAAADPRAFDGLQAELQDLVLVSHGPGSPEDALDPSSYDLIRLVLSRVLGCAPTTAAAAQVATRLWFAHVEALTGILNLLVEALPVARHVIVCDPSGSWIPVGLLRWLQSEDHARLRVSASTRWIVAPSWPVPVLQVFVPQIQVNDCGVAGGDLRPPLIDPSLVGIRRQAAAYATRWSHPSQTLGDIAQIASWDRYAGSCLLLHRGIAPQSGWEDLAGYFGITAQPGWLGSAFARCQTANETPMPAVFYAWLTSPFEGMRA
jgi:hypothetical protein